MASYSNPGVLLAAALVNSDCARKGELLDSSTALADLLARHGWSDEPVTEEDARTVRRLRPALRAVFTAASEDQAVRKVNALIERTRCLARLSRSDGDLRYGLHSDGPLPQRIACAAAGGLAEALRIGGFERMRECADDTCTDVFIDASRNRSRRFCRPQTCGNRNNVAAFRSRRRAGARR